MDEITKEENTVKHIDIKKPQGLIFLCILTFIGSGFSAFSSFFVAITYNLIPTIVKDSPWADTAALIEMINAAGPLFFALMGLLYLGSLAGAIMMFNLKKIGFHFYTMTQLLMLLLPSLMIRDFELPVSNILLTGSFILAYAVNMRVLRLSR